MTSKTADSVHLSEAEKYRADIMRYFALFEDAFDELHGIVVKQVKIPGQYIGPHHNYPSMSTLDSGFPSFYDVGFYRDGAPLDYVGTIRPRGLFRILSEYPRPEMDFPKSAELAAFLRSHDIGKRLDLDRFVHEGISSDTPVHSLVGDAVERYLHLHGLNAPVEARRRRDVIRPLIFGTIMRSLNLRLVVPITMTHFQVDHFRLTETTYITRLSKKMQLARARMSTMGSGAVKMVVGAATHAFVSNDWNLEVDNILEVRKSLGQSSANVTDAIDSFFGALRIATGFSAGYAQILWVPRRWTLDYFCDLPSIYGTTLRQYPSEYDAYGWVRQGPSVTAEHLQEVRRIYRAILGSESEAVRLAMKRLNGCLTRTEAADAVLDGTIGLELLLGDDQNQSLSYKLRLRAGALALLHTETARTAPDVAEKVKRLYDDRSAIVHGRRKKRSKNASEPADTKHAETRLLASDLLRFVLDVVLTHPEYLIPTNIDEKLLLKGADAADTQESATPQRGRRKKGN